MQKWRHWVGIAVCWSGKIPTVVCQGAGGATLLKLHKARTRHTAHLLGRGGGSGGSWSLGRKLMEGASDGERLSLEGASDASP